MKLDKSSRNSFPLESASSSCSCLTCSSLRPVPVGLVAAAGGSEPLRGQLGRSPGTPGHPVRGSTVTAEGLVWLSLAGTGLRCPLGWQRPAAQAPPHPHRPHPPCPLCRGVGWVGWLIHVCTETYCPSLCTGPTPGAHTTPGLWPGHGLCAAGS